MALLFPYLQKFFEKYKGVFGSLLPTLNAFIFHGKDLFVATKDWIEIVLRIAHTSMFNTQEPMELNNTEGAILCQLVLQTLGNGVMDAYIPPLLQETLKRLEQKPCAIYLGRELYNIILCSICNNGPLTLATLEAQGKTSAVLKGLIGAAAQYSSTYDRKVLTIGLSNILTQPTLPVAVADCLSGILEAIVTVLQTQAAEETKRQLKADRKVVAIEDSDSDSDSDSDQDQDQDEKAEKLPGPAPEQPEAEIEMTDGGVKGESK